MNEIVRCGDYLEVDYVEPPPVVDERRKKANDQPNPNIYTEVISVNDAIQKFRLPYKNQTVDGYAISKIRQQLIQVKKDVEAHKVKDQAKIQQITDLMLELNNLQSLQKVDVEIKPFVSNNIQKSKFPPPQNYTLVLPFNTDIEKRVKKLQSLEYPYLMLSQLLVSILLGQKQQTFESKQRGAQNYAVIRNEDLITLSNRYQKVESTINGFSSLTDRINKDQSLHNNSMGFIHTLQQISDSHHDIQQQLGDNIKLVEKLQENWSQNKKVFNSAVVTLKERIAKLKKK